MFVNCINGILLLFFTRATKENVGVPKGTIKIIGPKQENVLSGTHRVLVLSLFCLCTTEKKNEQSAYVMNRMVMYFGMKPVVATEFTHR